MDQDPFEKMRRLNPVSVEAARKVAAGAIAAMPRDLQPHEEPAHVYQAADPHAGEREPQS